MDLPGYVSSVFTGIEVESFPDWKQTKVAGITLVVHTLIVQTDGDPMEL